MRIPLRKFDKGIYISTPEEGIPEGALTRGRGLDRDTPWLSRPGSTAIVAGDAHSITYFNDTYFYATGSAFLASTRAIPLRTGLSGNRLSFARMAPRAGQQDALYIAGGGDLFKVIYSEVPLCATADFTWNLSAGGTSEYYLTDSSGNNPNLLNPVAVIEDQSITLTTGTLGSLSTGQWNFGDNPSDSLGYNTIYVRLADSTTAHPGNHATDSIAYVTARAVRAFDCGIDAPSHSPVASSAGTGQLTGVYSYRCTFKNSQFGIRSNPSPVPATISVVPPEDSTTESATLQIPASYRLLINFNGAAGATTATDAAGRGHTINFAGNAALDTTHVQTGFGSACLHLDGATSSYISVPANQDFVFNDEFTIDFWVKFNSLTTTNYTGLCGALRAASRNHWAIGYHKGANLLVFDRATLNPTASSRYFRQVARWTWNASTGVWYHLALVGGWRTEQGSDSTSYWWGGSRNAVEITIDGSTLTRIGSSRYHINEYTLSGQSISGGANPVTLGQTPLYPLAIDGWIDSYRVMQAAAWKRPFTPSSAEYGGSTDTTSSVQYTAVGESILLTNIPASADPQVDTVEIWRTQAGGVAYFKLFEVANGESTYTDNTPDDQLGITEVPTDNVVPYRFFDDLIGPHNGSMFWITRRRTGERGRLYYSAIGRAETMEGFIEVSSDDDPLQKLVYYQGQLAVFSQSRFFQILGSNPYFTKEVTGIPGTIRPHSVSVTPYGITYEASDRTFRLITGLQSQRFDDPIARVVAGEAAANLAAWGGGTSATIGVYARGEYLICDSTQTFCYSFEQRRIRELGLACKALYYNHETNQLLATVGSTLLEIEKSGELSDNGTAITYELQTGSVLLSDDKRGIIQWVHVDCNTNDETLTCELVYDSESTLTLGTVSTTGDRKVTTFPVNRHAQLAAVRLTGSLSSGQIALYGIDIDAYIPGEERQ